MKLQVSKDPGDNPVLKEGAVAQQCLHSIDVASMGGQAGGLGLGQQPTQET